MKKGVDEALEKIGHRNVRTILLASFLFVVAGLFCAHRAAAQETADIVGTVTDTSGAVLPGATVTLTNVATNVSRTSQTGGTGDYEFPLVQVGTYVVKVEMKGFKTFSATAIPVSSGDRARVDAKLEVGDVTQTVEVSGSAAPALQTDTSNIGALVPSQSVEDLPLNGRNLIKLVQLSPGTTEGSPGSIGAGNRPDDRRQTSVFSVNGQSDFQNNNMIDGMDNNTRIIGTLVVRPSIDAIQEVNISTNKYDASLGRTAGGVVDVITKAGTNDFHGSAYEFFRNKDLNTNPNYNFSEALNPGTTSPAAPNPAFRQNQYGGSLGGPIRKNKTFFFGDYEGFSYATGLPASFFNVPTYCERGMGNSSSPFAKPCPDGKVQVGDFSDTTLVSQAGGSSTPGGAGPDIMPTSTLGLAFFNMFPLPNTGAAGTTVNNYTSAPVKTQTSDTWDARVDQHFSDSNTLFVRFTHNGETTITPNNFPSVSIDPLTGNLAVSGGSNAVLVEPVVTSYAGANYETQNDIGASYVHVFNPSLVLNFKLGVFHSTIQSFPANQGSDVSTKLGFPCTAASCINASSDSSGLVNIATSSVNGSTTYPTIGDTAFIPLLYYDTGIQYMGALTWNKGSHSVRFGLGLIRRRSTTGQSNAAQGTFTFSGAYTGVALGDLLEGLPITLSRANSLVQPSFRMWEPSAYVQDDWRARPWLTVNLGLRYDIFTPFTEVHGRISNYDPYLGLMVSPSIPGIQQSNATAMIPTIYTDISPRIGFAATLPHNTVIRGGFGTAFFPVNNGAQWALKNAPFNFAPSCTIQNEAGSNNSCATAQLGTAPAGAFANSATSQYGLPVSNSSSNVGQTGGALLSAGLPTPALDITTATDLAKYGGARILAIPTNLQEASVVQTNFQVQKQFGANVVTVGYVGDFGRHQREAGTNQNQPANPDEAKTPPLTLGGQTVFGVLPGFSYLKSVNLGEAGNWGTSSYNALQATVVRRFKSGLTVNFNYTWAHTLSNVNDTSCWASYYATPEPCYISDGNGGHVDEIGFQHYAWGNDVQDVADRLSWAVNYNLPFGKSWTGVIGAIVKGWGANASGSWQTGLPFSVTAASNNSGLSVTQRLDQHGAGRLSNPTLRQWFDLADFTQPPANTLGDQHVMQLFGPSQTRFDFSLFKEFPIEERFRLQFRTEVFNLFNTPNFGNPVSSIAFNSDGSVNLKGSRATTGEITSMNGNWNQREIQFALRLMF